MWDFIFSIVKEHLYLQYAAVFLIFIVMLATAGYALYVLFKSYKKISVQSNIDKILSKNNKLKSSNSHLNSFIDAESTIYKKFLIQTSIVDDYYSDPYIHSDLPKNLIREFLDNFVMISGSLKIKKNTDVRIILWELKPDLTRKIHIGLKTEKFLSPMVSSSNYLGISHNKRMSLNDSIVGRSYRTASNQVVFDINQDPDFNKKGELDYSSVITIYHTSIDKKNYVLSFDFKNDDPKYFDFLQRMSIFIINVFEHAKELEYLKQQSYLKRKSRPTVALNKQYDEEYDEEYDEDYEN